MARTPRAPRARRSQPQTSSGCLAAASAVRARAVDFASRRPRLCRLVGRDLVVLGAARRAPDPRVRDFVAAVPLAEATVDTTVTSVPRPQQGLISWSAEGDSRIF